MPTVVGLERLDMIELKDIVLRYGNRKILNAVDLNIRDGETLVILGGSGAGKSTLLRLIIGLEKPTSGSLTVDGFDVVSMNEKELDEVRRRMGMVFQYSALFDSLNVRENVAFGLREHTDMTEEEVRIRVAECLALVDLPGTEELMPSELSGGMKKRVGLARAIAFRPSVILYDEPTSGLDPVTSATISRLIRSMQEHLKCTSVVVTHDMASAFFMADRIALLYGGDFIEVSETERFKSSTNPIVRQFIHGLEIGTREVRVDERNE